MVESEFEQELITNIKRARRINTLWIFSLLLMYVLMCVYPLLFLVFIALLVFRILFRKYFRAEINYELDEIANNKWKDFVCVRDNGELLKLDYVTRHFPMLCEQCGLRRITFHQLRHTNISLLLSAGISIKEIQEWTGHSTYTTTVNIKYPHKFKVTVKAT